MAYVVMAYIVIDYIGMASAVTDYIIVRYVVIAYVVAGAAPTAAPTRLLPSLLVFCWQGRWLLVKPKCWRGLRSGRSLDQPLPTLYSYAMT